MRRAGGGGQGRNFALVLHRATSIGRSVYDGEGAAKRSQAQIVVYFDFEYILVKYTSQRGKSCHIVIISYTSVLKIQYSLVNGLDGIDCGSGGCFAPFSTPNFTADLLGFATMSATSSASFLTDGIIFSSSSRRVAVPRLIGSRATWLV